MVRCALALLVCVLAVAGCGGDDPPRAAQQPAPTPTATPPPPLPEPDGALPGEPGELAAQLLDVDARLRSAIEAWREADGARAATPEDVTLLALRQQRVYQRLARNRGLARDVLPQLRGRTLGQTRDVLAAMRAIATLNAPYAKLRRRFRTGPPPAPALLRSYYRSASRRFDVDWPLLAAVHFVESAFSRMRNSSAAGAQGPMQFIPSTWKAYGLGGDVHDTRDAILGAANYLSANGAATDEAGALYHYNPSRLYVRAVSRYARRIRRDPLTFYAFHSWQVFVRTPDGLRRLTGP
jgi:membrane-bound lytic murein transglycosylase B